MQHQMIPLFSVPLYKASIGELDVLQKTWIRELDFPPQSVGTDHSDDHLPPENRGMHLLDTPQLKSLKANIQKSLKHFTKDVLGIKEEFRITTGWINRNNKGEQIYKHSHPNSVISGVYYIETTPDCAPIIFEKPYLYTNIAHQNVQLTYEENNKNEYNTDYYGVKPKPGEVLMFPSWLEHTVYPQPADVARISLAFNSFPVGKIGSGTKQLEI